MSKFRVSKVLFVSELIVLLFTLLVFFLYTQLTVFSRQPLELYLTRIGGNSLLYISALFICLLLIRLKDIRFALKTATKRSLRDTFAVFRQRYLKFGDLLTDFRYLNLVSVLFVVFINLKHLLPFLARSNESGMRSFDSLFVNLESRIFGERLLTGHLQDFFAPSAAEILSTSYTLFYGYVAILVFSMLLLRNRSLRDEFFTAFVLVWLLGLVVVFLIPTWGPCFYLPEIIKKLPYTSVVEMQQRLWLMKLELDIDPQSKVATYFISGFPSLHFAVVLLGTFYLRRIHILLSICSLVFLLATFLSTIYFGWHYLLDDVAALPLVAFCIWLARLLAKFQTTSSSAIHGN